MGRSKAHNIRKAANKANGQPGRPGPAIAQQASEDRYKIVVAVDYGTTYSGVAYVTSNHRNIEDISIVTSWPGDAATSWKTPTRIAYASENRNFGNDPESIANNKWGFEVEPRHKSYSWTKLLLDERTTLTDFDDPNLALIKQQGFMQLPESKDAAGVCEDFLREVYNHISARIKREISVATYDLTPMEC